VKKKLGPSNHNPTCAVLQLMFQFGGAKHPKAPPLRGDWSGI